VGAFFAALALALPLLDFYDPKPSKSISDGLALIGLAAMFGVPALFIAWDTLHCRIVASAEGLTFYDFFKTRFVPWSAVRDYGYRPYTRKAASMKMEGVVLIEEEWREIPLRYVNYAELLEVIAQNAKQSRSCEWKRLGEVDDGKWPKTFELWAGSGWVVIGYGLLVHIPLLVLSWWGRALPLFFLYSPLLALVQWAMVEQIKATRPFLDRKIVARREGLEYIQGAQSTFIPWREIESYHLEVAPGNVAPKLAVIESQGRRIEFPVTPQLLLVVHDWAANASTENWRYLQGEDEMMIGGATSQWEGGHIGVGAKIYHCRTVLVRGLLILFIAMTLSMASMPFLMSWTAETPFSQEDLFSSLAFLFGLGIPSLFLLWTYYFASIRCEETGLRQRSLRGERFVRWDDIQRIKTSGPIYTVFGKTDTIRLSWFLADFQGLRNEIERRSGLEGSEDAPAQSEASNDSI
jgi:hypothetical protein